MRLRPLNKTLIIEPESDLIPIDESADVEGAVKRGLILLPEKNSLMKLSPFARVVRAANDCWYPFKKGQKIVYNQFFDKPLWHEEDGKRYRFIKEWYVTLIYES